MHDLSKQQSAAIKSFASGSDTFVSLLTEHGKSLIYQLAIPLAKELRKHSGLFSPSIRPMLLVVSPLNALIDDQIRSCEVFGLKCVKLEEFKEGDSVDLLLSSPETLEKHYEDLSNLSENILLFHVVFLLTTAKKWTKIKNARAKRAELLFLPTKYANL